MFSFDHCNLYLLGPVLLLLPLLAATPGLGLNDTLPQQPGKNMLRL